MWEGTVVSIHVAEEASATMQSITEVRAFPGRGIEGDRYFAGTGFYSKKSRYGGGGGPLIEKGTVGGRFAGGVKVGGRGLGRQVAVARTPAENTPYRLPPTHSVSP